MRVAQESLNTSRNNDLPLETLLYNERAYIALPG